MSTEQYSARAPRAIALQHAIDWPAVRQGLFSWRVLVLVLLFCAAFGIRMHYITAPPVNFHPTRQYRSLILARAFYLDLSSAAPDAGKEVARFSAEKQGILEPPLQEQLVAFIYSILGGEQLWVGRFLSVLFWLIGGGFLYLQGKKLSDANSALFSLAFYLLLPFGVVASQSFQPDPLMVMLMLAALFAIFRYHEIPSNSRLISAAVVSALAFLVKPGCVFILISAFLALAISRRELGRKIRASGVFIVITLAPTLLIYAYGILTHRFLVAEAQKTLMPLLALSPFFWRGWLVNLGETIGFAALIGALLGVLLFHSGAPRAFMVGLWVGYVLFGFALNYNFASHNYYQLPFIPIVALSVGPVGALIITHLYRTHSQWYWRGAVAGIFVLASVLALADARARLTNLDAQHKVTAAQEIGELVNHSTNTIFLAGDYGVPLEYHGLLSGQPWPLASDLQWEQLSNLPALDAPTRFHKDFAQAVPDYFIVEDLREFEQQRDLKEFLMANFPLVAQSAYYMVFDLKPK